MNSLIRVLGKNSTTILTGLSAFGVVSTGALAAEGGGKAYRILDHQVRNHRVNYQMSRKETVKLVWKCFVPAAIMGGITIGLIIGAHKLHLGKEAALAGACSLGAATLREYQNKVIETIGADKHNAIKDSIHADRIANNPVGSREVLIVGTGDVLCYETLSGRYFQSDKQTILAAQNDLNRDLLNDMWVDLNDVYDALGLPPTRLGAELGWSVNDSNVEFKFSTQETPDGRPCLVIDYQVTPGSDYGSR